MPPVLSIVGHSGSGKTTLIERLAAALAERGRRLVVIKHHGHAATADRPHKDTARVRAAGAVTAVLASSVELAVFRNLSRPLGLAELVAEYGAGADVVLCEGFHLEPGPKVEVWRRAVAPAPLCLGDPALLALVTDDPVDAPVRRVALGDVPALLALLGSL
ncbi:MAG TPA: molybdopterin-guanine dinucleotide biosynthesis protein B [Polyangia bacterium]|jgi:molybdopterin-guanine dinucleotide biosynthesis protein MobB